MIICIINYKDKFNIFISKFLTAVTKINNNHDNNNNKALQLNENIFVLLGN